MANQDKTYDIIFAGGGTTACVVAGRLAEADPTLKILIIEAGPHTREVQEILQPASCFSILFDDGKNFTFHTAAPSEKSGNRPFLVPAARALGGGSSVNFVQYTRASASDYDDWETLYGNDGWGSKNLIPLLKKAETYQAKSSNDTHGLSGPIKVSLAKSQINIAESFLDVAAKYDKARSLSDDLSPFNECNKYARWPRYIDGDSGRRSDTAHYYIYSQDGNKNLHVLDRQRVVRILFEGTLAVGVEYVDDIAGRDGGGVKPERAYASRLVVLSAGAFGSPAILERSGIGASEVLQSNGVEQLVDLHGVGENYTDHPIMRYTYLASEDADTMDNIFKGNEEYLAPFVKQWHETGQGLMAHNALDAGIKFRPIEGELPEIGPTFEDRWKTYYANSPDKPLFLMGIFAAYITVTKPDVPKTKLFTMSCFLGYPSSIGRVHITSGQNPYARQAFEPRCFDNEDDVAVARWAYKKQRELARRNKYYLGPLNLEHPKFAAGSDAFIIVKDGPDDIDVPDITYTAEDDKAIDDFNRQKAATCSHSMGTCAMKPREQGGVVDKRLNVYGVQGLKVADLSISPANVGANTCNTALAIGEKAAIIIAEDLGIQGVTAT